MVRSPYSKAVCALLALAAFIAICYSNIIKVPFQFDDYPNIVDNKFIKIDRLQTKELLQAATSGRSLHRWVPNLSFAVQYYFSALNTPAYHIFNITVHFFCATILYFLFLTTLDYAGSPCDKTRKYELAFVATILWSLHPIQTNAVTYIVQRMTSLSTLFYLSAVFLYARGRLPNQPSRYRYPLFIAAGISGLLAITSKENAAMLPLNIFAYELFIISPDVSPFHRRRTFIALGLTFLFLLVMGWFWIGQNIFAQILQGYNARYFSLSERLMTEPRVIFYYLSLLIYPALSRLNIDHDITISSSLFSPPTTIIAIFGILLLTYSIGYFFNKNRILSFAIFWFFINLVIESSIIPLELCFEHRLYLPATFLFFAMTIISYRFIESKISLLRLGICILIIAFGILTWNRNLVWQSEISLWSDAVDKSPNLIRPYANLSNALKNEQRYAEAEEYLHKILEIDAKRKVDRDHPAWKHEMSALQTDIALVHRHNKNLPEAMQHIEEALRLEPDSEYAMLTYAILLTELGRYDTADGIFTEIAANGIDTVELYQNWGLCAVGSGDFDRAINLFTHAVSLDPDNRQSHYNLGLAYGNKGMTEDARREMAFGMGL